MTEGTPRHVGYIIDGNRRWAKKHGIPVYEGHLAGYNSVKEVVLETFDQNVKYVSVYLFSTENWKRGQEEIGNIMNLALRMLTADINIFQDNNIRFLWSGVEQGLSKSILKALKKAEEVTKDNTRGTFNLCFNYGGQLEIADACKKIIQQGISPDEITPELVSQYIYNSAIPPVDLIVRTSGEQRISNFMLWRAAYAELLFIEKLWPDMTKDDVSIILKEYIQRDRRIGG